MAIKVMSLQSIKEVFGRVGVWRPEFRAFALVLLAVRLDFL